MESVYISIAGFSICTLAIILSGVKLTKYGDAIAELTGLGKAWIGLVLMASVTSLPELINGISSVAFLSQPDLAAGDIFGSCIFNLLILSLVDARIKKPLTSLLKSNHVFTGLAGIVLISVSGLAIVLRDITPVLYWVSPFTIFIFLVYFLVVYGIFQHERLTELPFKPEEVAKQQKEQLRTVIKYYILNAFLVIAAAAFLPYFGEGIASHFGLGKTFFGTLFLATSTSLPELVVSFVAIRMGSFDLLVGNLLGSNIFNIFILGLDDLFYTKGSLFADISTDHLQTIMVVIIMTAVLGLGIMAKPTRKLWKLSLDTTIILLLYIGLMMVLYYG
ncbi:hypothetical protein [Nibribacter koreensis]|uniref:Sodium:calcium antiporter n=1 Tax=Nibribacter koreensis TaxID=1084519 RepID=A0ABP8FAZ7_9BACT